MATVRLSDAVIPEVYLTYQALNTPELTAFWQAGLVVRNDMMDTIARNGGKEATLPFWNDLDSSIEPNMSNDDPDDKATPNKVGSGQMKCRKAFMNQGYSSMDLIVELAGSDPMQHIRNRFGTYWARQYQRRLIASLRGVMADNIANDNSDMTIDISAEAGNAAIFNADAVIDAAGTMGDAQMNGGRFSAIAVHSKIHTRMVKNNEIVTIQDSVTGLFIPTYKEMRVIVDDALVIGSGASAVYFSVLIGAGFFGYGSQLGNLFAEGEGIPRTPVAIERDERAGNGGGEETIWERKTTILHPQGFSWTDAEGTADALTEFSPTLADLIKAAHWNRVVQRKQAPVAFLLSKA
jgi:hypothetical protein